MRLRGRPGATTSTQTPKSPKSAKALEILHPPDVPRRQTSRPEAPQDDAPTEDSGQRRRVQAKEVITDDESHLRFYFRPHHGSMKTRAHGHAPTHDKDHDRPTRRPNENSAHGHGNGTPTSTTHEYGPAYIIKTREHGLDFDRHGYDTSTDIARLERGAEYPVDTAHHGPRRRYCPRLTRSTEPMAPTTLRPRMKPSPSSSGRARNTTHQRRGLKCERHVLLRAGAGALGLRGRGKEKPAHFLRGTRERSTRLCRAADGRRARRFDRASMRRSGYEGGCTPTASRARTMRRVFAGLPARAACGRKSEEVKCKEKGVYLLLAS
ncbi:hypothetical protein B0H17DRAFT_1236011 [Mycena rosella]|uniref:Uncharacterized protein n=1 Tax=Mycena rosella TaxID=1033263 RepID=A0AAD7G8K0_MYCRO|nr:hypothetical protein B0H17DRAFT_1236011 [Mycena rosella]